MPKNNEKDREPQFHLWHHRVGSPRQIHRTKGKQTGTQGRPSACGVHCQLTRDVRGQLHILRESSLPRLALQHGDGHVVDYLAQPVIDYILKSQLYITASG